MNADNNTPLRGPRLRIVAVNDVYVLDHLPSLRGLVLRQLQHDPADQLLVTMAGDFVAPSLLSSLDSGRGMVECMNRVGFTHAILGNHEDDVPTPELSERIRELACPCLGTNVRGFTPELPRFDVVTIEGPARTVRVALLGVVMDDPTVYQRVPFGGATLLPPNGAIRAQATQLLEARACDAVIAMTHQGIEHDRALLAGGAQVALVVGGHDHQVFLEQVQNTWIVKAGADAVHAAVIDLEWLDGADTPSVSVVLEDVASYPEDAALRAHVERLMQRVDSLASATLRVLEPGEELSSVGTREHQTSLGTALTSRLRDTLHADVCVFNGGGIRGSRTYRQQISYADLETEVPFANEVVCAALPGAVLERAIVFSRSHAPAEFGGFLQVCDALELGPDNHVLRVRGEPFDAARLYRVALVRNLFTGMDGVQPLVDYARAYPDAIPPIGSGRDVKLALLEGFARAAWQRLGGLAGLDRDGDGVVNAAEFERGLCHDGDGSSAVIAQVLLRALDQNGDGQMTRDDDDLLGEF